VHLAEGSSVFYGHPRRGRVGRATGAIIHGVTIGNHVLVGMGTTVMNSAAIGDEVLIAAGALITAGMEVPPQMLVAGVPAKVRRELTAEEIERLHMNTAIYEQHEELQRGGTGVG